MYTKNILNSSKSRRCSDLLITFGILLVSDKTQSRDLRFQKKNSDHLRLYNMF
jgi:hypothetical protein